MAFCERQRLERRFGSLIAERVGTRLQVLLAARHLALVPTAAPIGLRIVDPQKAHFAVALAESKRLRFRATEGCTYRDGHVLLETVVEIEILGVEED